MILHKYNYEQPKTIFDYRISIDFDLTAQTSLLVAISSILETESFYDVFYQVISVGGDSDTYAAIAGPIAEIIYGLEYDSLLNIQPYFKEYDQKILVSLQKLYN